MALYRHKVEGQIKRSEDRFKKLAELAPFGLSLIGGDGEFKYVNDVFSEIFGYRPEDIPDWRTWLDLTRSGSDSDKEIWTQWRGWDEGENADFEKCAGEWTLNCKSGEKKVVSIRVTSLDDGSAILAYHDVTPAAKARENLELRVRERTRELLKQKDELERQIVQRIEAEEALLASERRFRAIFQIRPRMRVHQRRRWILC